MKIKLTDTIKDIIKEIPNEKENKPFFKELIKIFNDSLKKDPDTTVSWKLVDNSISKFLNGSQPWHLKVESYFKETYEKYQHQLDLMFSDYDAFLNLIKK
jgi:hypothetical protein